MLHFEHSNAGQTTSERNTCTVRALSLAAGLTYEQAHQIAEEAGRKRDGRVLMWDVLAKAVQYHVKFDVFVFQSQDGGPVTVADLSAVLPPLGKFIVRYSGHAFVVIDGVIRDTKQRQGKKIVTNIWRIIWHD